MVSLNGHLTMLPFLSQGVRWCGADLIPCLLIPEYGQSNTPVSFVIYGIIKLIKISLFAMVHSIGVIWIRIRDPMMNPSWNRIDRFICNCTMVQVISDHWSWSGFSQRNTSLNLSEYFWIISGASSCQPRHPFGQQNYWPKGLLILILCTSCHVCWLLTTILF